MQTERCAAGAALLAACVSLGSAASGCAEQLRPLGEGEVLALGDSVLEWNLDDERSIPDFIGREAGLSVVNGAVSGSMMLDGGPERIPARYESRDWRWVVLEGGANDLGDGCGCGDCMHVVDQIIAPELDAGEMVELVERAAGDGARIVLLGYYRVAEGTEFDGCEDEFDALDARYAALADAREGVWFFDMGEIADPVAHPEYYDDDQIHPSAAGSEAIGRVIGQLIAGLE